MADKRTDSRGRKLHTGEYYDSNNKRYIFRKMIDGERVSITAPDLVSLRQQENELLCRIDKGAKVRAQSARMLLNDYFDYWFETYAKGGRKATTCTNYKSYYNTYIKNTIGKKKITKITKADCQKIINTMSEEGKKHSTMSNLKSCLNAIFECAIDEEIILKNPVKNIQLPQTESTKREPVEQRQAELFMDYVKNNPCYAYTYPAFVVLFNVGARVGEMAALTWEDVDFENNTICINKTVNRYRKADYGFTRAIASPKSKSSVRTVMMSNAVRKVLLKHKLQYGTTKETLPFVDDSGHKRGSVTGFVFLNLSGTTWTEPCFLSLIGRIVEHYNRDAKENNKEPLENFCPHMARHTYTSLAYEAGVDAKVVSGILGHASTAVTLDVYTHLTEEKKRQQEAAIQAVQVL